MSTLIRPVWKYAIKSQHLMSWPIFIQTNNYAITNCTLQIGSFIKAYVQYLRKKSYNRLLPRYCRYSKQNKSYIELGSTVFKQIWRSYLKIMIFKRRIDISSSFLWLIIMLHHQKGWHNWWHNKINLYSHTSKMSIVYGNNFVACEKT